MKSLTVVSPVYNEEEVIVSFYTELKRALVSLADTYQSTIIFVLDRSQDATLEKLRDICSVDQSVSVLALSSRFGHQMSLLAGIDHCDSDALIMMDCDLQHPPALIPKMLEKFECGYDIVYTIRQDSKDISFFKRITSSLFYWGINRIAEVSINESAADFRLISRRVVGLFQTQIRERNLFLRGLMGWIGFKSVGIPFQVCARKAGKTKYSLWRMLRFGLDGVVGFSKFFLLAAICVGFVFAIFGVLLAIITIIQYFVYAHLPPGWATLTVLLSFFSGIQLFFMGILGAYVGAIFDEVKARPHYIIDERINI